MPDSKRSSFQHFVFGDSVFAEHEGLLAFQHRFLISITLAVCCFVLALIAIFLLTSPPSPALTFVLSYWSFTVVSNLLLWRWIRVHPRRVKTSSLLIALLYLGNICIPGVHLPPDPLLPMWNTLLVVGCFMLAGRPWGWISCAVAIAASHWLLTPIDMSTYPNAYLTIWSCLLGSAVLGHIYVERFNYFFTQLEYYNQQLLRLSTVDHLTGALNVGAYYAQCNTQLANCQRRRLPCAVLFIDLDHFKKVNDNYGHAMGDHVLQQVALLLKSCLRKDDLLGRVGGEEFSVFLPGAQIPDCNTIAERIRASIEAQVFAFNGQQLRMTASVGLTWIELPAKNTQSIDEIQQQADKAMYKAKQAGRNRVCHFDPQRFEEMAMQ